MNSETVVTWLGVKPRWARPARDVARVGRDEEGREEAVGGLHGRVEQDLVLVVVADPHLGLGGGRGRQRARPEQPPQAVDADVGARAHQADERQRGRVLGRGGELLAQQRLVLGGEHDVRGRGLLRRARRRSRRRARPRPRPRRASSSPRCAARQSPPRHMSLLARELVAPLGGRVGGQLGQPRRRGGQRGPVGGGDLEHAEERARGAVAAW